jgi:hypothetical protein
MSFTLIIKLVLDGDPDHGMTVVESLLDSGTIQDAILEHDNDTEDCADDCPLEVTSALVEFGPDHVVWPVSEQHSNLLTLTKTEQGHLALAPTPAGVDRAKEYLLDREIDPMPDSAAPDTQLFDMLEYFLGNGWMQVPPDRVGALTDALIISEDGTIPDEADGWTPYPDVKRPRVYAHMNYQVEDPIVTWAAGGAVIFEGYDVEGKEGA